MSKKSVSVQVPQGKSVLPRLPHPSWVWAMSGGGETPSRVSSAEDFWNRLGL